MRFQLRLSSLGKKQPAQVRYSSDAIGTGAVPICWNVEFGRPVVSKKHLVESLAQDCNRFGVGSRPVLACTV